MARANTPKTRRGEDTRKRILEKTRALLAEAGSGGATLDRVSEAAGVAKSSILWHFGSKEELFIEVLGEVMDEFEAMASGRFGPGMTPSERLRAFFDDFAGLARRFPEASRILLASLFDPDLMARLGPRVADMYRRFRASIAGHLNQSGCDVGENEAAVILALLEGVFLQWHIDKDLEMEPVFQAAAGLMAKALDGQ